jgi:putative heme iron utilization protein
MVDPDFDAGKVARSLLRRSRQGALASLLGESGDPYCSLVNVASAPDGAPILLISALALHTRNILADPRVSLMLDERRAADPLEGTRAMIGGIAEQVPQADLEVIRRRYLAAQPASEAFVSFKDFSFFTIQIKAVHLVAGFGRIVDLTRNQVLTDLSGAGALLEAEPEILDHINADHRDTMNLYATRLLGGEAGDWRCVSCDPDGMDLQNGRDTLRLDFPRRIVAPAALRKTLKDMAERARSS